MKPGLAFSRLSIQRMPGFPEGGVTVDELAPGINVIHGPNASGKTTFAMALRSVLWPSLADECAILVAEAETDGGKWRFDLGGNRLRTQRNGAEASSPVAVAEVEADRYILALHDLLRQEGKDRFAEAVFRESVGGYDLEAALASRGYEKTGIRKLFEAYAASDDSLRESISAQKGLLEEEGRLAGLEARLADARAAREETLRLELALKLHDARLDADAAEADLAKFDKRLARLHGNEGRTLAELRAERGRLENQRRDAEAAAERARREVVELNLPESFPPAVCGELRRRSASLIRMEDQLRSEKSKAAASRAEAEGHLTFFRGSVDPARMRGIDRAMLDRLARIARDAEGLAGDRRFLERERAWLTSSEEAEEADRLRMALGFLHEWLKALPPSSVNRGANAGLVIGGTALAVTGALLALDVHAGFWLVSAAGLALPLLGRWRPEADLRAVSAEAYERCGFKCPREWTYGSVVSLATELAGKLARADVEREKARRWQDLAGDLARAEEAAERLKAETERVASDIGFDPALASEADPVPLHVTALRLAEWHACEAARASAEEAVRLLQADMGTELQVANALLARLGEAAVADGAALDAAAEHLARRVERHQELRRVIADHEDALARRIEPDIAECLGRARELFAGAGLEDGEHRALEDMVQKLEAYREAVKRAADARREVGRIETELGDDAGTAASSRADISARLEEARSSAREYESLLQSITAIRARIEHEMRGHAVEDALARREDAERLAKEKFDEADRECAGERIVAYLKRSGRHAERPRVFARAHEIFALITRGRYRLDFDDERQAFRAIDTATGGGLEADQLSSGTRLQMLMAVRLAFLEETEHGLKLPLVLDETLANSDDVRARQIIEAAVEIARSGRQVFYLTAQADEVGKWNDAMSASPGVSYRVAQLAGLAATDVRAGPVAAVEILRAPRAEPPAPGGHTHAAYGGLIGVRRFNALTDDPGSLHLWYLADDLEVLHKCLSANLSTWGEFETLSAIGRDPLGNDERGRARLAAAMRAARAACRLWRRGRGRPVTAAALADSGQVPPKAMDEAAGLAESVGWDARALLDVVHKAKGVGRAKVDKLREYLAERGFLDDAEPLDPASLRAALRQACEADIARGLLDDSGLEHLTVRLLGPNR